MKFVWILGQLSNQTFAHLVSVTQMYFNLYLNVFQAWNLMLLLGQAMMLTWSL